jgi:hypothetical protein
LERHVAELLLAKAGEDGGREILVALGRESALHDFDRACAVVFAVRLFEQQVDRLEIRNRIIVRYGLTLRTVYRIIDEALQRFCQPRRVSGNPIDDAMYSTTTERNE